ncbi:MAG: hypothetical protein Q8L92_12485 [Rubrivivax sp.]|nr:hypothetical protein [Rubrivivax sp.]
MRQRTDLATPTAHAAANMKTLSPQRLACPHCQAPVKRVPRGLIDRLISVFVPIWRFACPAPRCGWTGLVRRGAPGTLRYDHRKVYADGQALEPRAQHLRG